MSAAVQRERERQRARQKCITLITSHLFCGLSLNWCLYRSSECTRISKLVMSGIVLSELLDLHNLFKNEQQQQQKFACINSVARLAENSATMNKFLRALFLSPCSVLFVHSCVSFFICFTLCFVFFFHCQKLYTSIFSSMEWASTRNISLFCCCFDRIQVQWLIRITTQNTK